MEKKTVNIRKGIRGRSEGVAFEAYLIRSAWLSGLRVVPIPSGCRMIKGKFGRPQLLPVKTPFDMIFSNKKGKAAFIDSKSISGDTLVYSFLTPHQVNILSDLETDGHVAGYVVHFKASNAVVFFKGSQLQSLRSRESLKQEEGLSLGDLFNLKLGGLFQCQE
jgi:hypothetical protein